jgi:putative ABC transport system permease protein
VNVTLSQWLPTAVAIILLAGVATAALLTGRIRTPWAATSAIARAAIQLTALSLVLAGILADPFWVGVGLVVMFVAAAWTVVRRTTATALGAAAIGTAMLVGNLVVIGVVFASGAVEFSPRYVLAVGGIVIGNTMSIATLTSRAFTTSLGDRWDEVEGWLALGATPRESTRWLAREAVFSALVPSIDQTRTTGIVVLPGAFVGAIFGGASPLEAGRFQLIVLASILAAGAITATVLVRFLGNVSRKPVASGLN